MKKRETTKSTNNIYSTRGILHACISLISMGGLELHERHYDTDNTTNGGANRDDILPVVVNKLVHLDPRPLVPVILDLYHDEGIAASFAQAMQAGEEVECLVIVEPCSLQDTVGSQLMHVLLPMHQHGQQEEVRADSRVFKFGRVIVKKIWSRA